MSKSPACARGAVFLVRTLRQTSRLVPASSQACHARPLAPRKARQGPAEAGDRLTREVLQVPEEYRIGIVPASDTGAVEMALWSMLAPRAVDMLAWESFGEGWVTDVVKQLKLKDARVIEAAYGELPDLARSIRTATWSSPGTARPRACAFPTPISSPPTAQGLTICDATSAAFAQRLDFGQARCRDLLLAEGARRRGTKKRPSFASTGASSPRVIASPRSNIEHGHRRRETEKCERLDGWRYWSRSAAPV